MGQPEPSSIRRRLQISVTLAVAILFSLGSLGVYAYVRYQEQSEFLESLERRLEIQAAEIEENYSGAIAANFHDRAVERFHSIQASQDAEALKHPDAVYYVVRNDQGNPLMKSPWLDDESRLPFRRQSRNGQVEFGATTLSGGRHAQTASTTFLLPAENSGPGESTSGSRLHLVVAERDDGMRDMLAILGLSLFAVGILITCATAILIALLVKRACRPIGSLSTECAKIDSDNLNARLAGEQTPEELLPLVFQFNALLERVEQAFQRERRFTIDIAHELRTPISELRSLAEVALEPCPDGVAAEDPIDVYRETARIGKRIGRLVETLSALYRSESGSIQVKPQDVNLPELLAASVDSNLANPSSGDRRFEIEGDGPIVVQTDPVLLRGIFDNLVGNSLTHSVPSSRTKCRIGSATEKSGPFVEISNETDQLSDEDLPHLGEPLWQKDSARSDPGNFGLGLSLAAAYAKLLGVEIDYCLEGRQFFAKVRFP